MSGVPEPAGDRVKGAWCTNHRGGEVFSVQPDRTHRLVDDVSDAQLGGGIAARRAEPCTAEDLTSDVRDRCSSQHGGHVEADSVAEARIEPIGLRLRPTDAGAPAIAHHRADREETGEQLPGGWLGESGELAELGAGDRAVRQQEFHGRPVVDRPEQPRPTRCSHARVPPVN
jgi:hypothetical protein